MKVYRLTYKKKIIYGALIGEVGRDFSCHIMRVDKSMIVVDYRDLLKEIDDSILINYFTKLSLDQFVNENKNLNQIIDTIVFLLFDDRGNLKLNYTPKKTELAILLDWDLTYLDQKIQEFGFTYDQLIKEAKDSIVSSLLSQSTIIMGGERKILTTHFLYRVKERFGKEGSELFAFLNKFCGDKKEFVKPHFVAVKAMFRHNLKYARFFYSKNTDLIVVFDDHCQTLITCYKASECSWFGKVSFI